MLKRTPEQDALHGLFHKAWGQAKDSPSYDKQVWRELDVVIGEFTRPREAPAPTALDYEIRLRAGDEELWKGFPVGHWCALMGAMGRGAPLPQDSVDALEAWRKSKVEGA